MKEMESGAKCMLDFKSPIQGLLGVHSRYGLHTRAATNSWHAFRRLQLFRHLHSCSGCFRLERSPGGACTHWKAPPSHGAHPERSLLEASSREPAREWQQQDRSSLPCEAGPVGYPRRGRITPSKACTSASGISYAVSSLRKKNKNTC